ncbi:MAG: hypothetical protein SZ59_C0001G0042 [candidate division TM6 bacterium GW2011_GWF2_28_16]|nr:MAG: hypothetical protein SZ59_C0001G0042 [candidate division TM6 bacterium GW2011_GWF2_28_16]
MNINNLKHISILSLFVILSFSGCNTLKSSKEIVDMQNFSKIIEGKYNNISEALKLFPVSTQDVENRVKFLKEIVNSGIKELLNIDKNLRTFENTVKALDNLEFKYSSASHAIATFELVCPDNELREACHEATLELDKFAIDTFLNREIYKAFKDYFDLNFKKEDLDSEQKYYVQESLSDYKRAGFDLPDNEFEKIKQIKKEISQKVLEFEKNINTDNSFIEVDESDLAGVDKDFVASLTKSDSGKYILKCDYPTYANVMQYCTNANTRKNLYFCFNNRAYPKNIDNLNFVINKREELANILGFESFASLDLDDQMVKNVNRAKKFLHDLVAKTVIKMNKEFEILLQDLPEGVELDKDGKINSWDYKFALESYKKKHFDIDEQKIAEYFPVQNTVNKIFEIYQQFLSLKFELVNIDNAWNKDVIAIKIYEKNDNKLRGYLFLDLYPRENKYSHACMCDIVLPAKYKNDENLAVIMVIANFPKATKDKPALLKHRDVETFFHEFGHAMHGFLGKTQMHGFAGTNTKTDFVELPSQMFEEWMWDKNMLKLATAHYQTGQPLPEEIINKKIELKNFDSGYFVTRQVVLSLLSLECFVEGKDKNIDKLNKDLFEKYITKIKFEPDAHFWAAFGHLMGYAAKYYGYMWSKVFAIDLFYKIKESGLLNAQEGERIVNLVLGRGGSKDPDILLKDYLGREPNQDAFLKDLGIK